jgi:hypothetical protein
MTTVRGTGCVLAYLNAVCVDLHRLQTVLEPRYSAVKEAIITNGVRDKSMGLVLFFFLFFFLLGLTSRS